MDLYNIQLEYTILIIFLKGFCTAQTTHTIGKRLPLSNVRSLVQKEQTGCIGAARFHTLFNV